VSRHYGGRKSQTEGNGKEESEDQSPRHSQDEDTSMPPCWKAIAPPGSVTLENGVLRNTKGRPATREGRQKYWSNNKIRRKSNSDDRRKGDLTPLGREGLDRADNGGRGGGEKGEVHRPTKIATTRTEKMPRRQRRCQGSRIHQKALMVRTSFKRGEKGRLTKRTSK